MTREQLRSAVAALQTATFAHVVFWATLTPEQRGLFAAIGQAVATSDAVADGVLSFVPKGEGMPAPPPAPTIGQRVLALELKVELLSRQLAEVIAALERLPKGTP